MSNTFSECPKCGQPFTDSNFILDPVRNAPVHFVCPVPNTVSSGTEHNSITPQQEEPKQPDIPFHAVYQWSSELTHEQNTDTKNYQWTEQTSNLLRRLQNTKNQLIAVVGLQGSGKTALMNALWEKLPNCHGVKWFGEKNTDAILREFSDIDIEHLASEVTLKYEAPTILKMIVAQPKEVQWGLHRILIKGEPATQKDHVLRYYLEKFLGPADLDRVKHETLNYDISKSNLLIDMPDYDRNNRGQMIRDLTEIHKFWENIDVLTDRSRQCNLVLFLQKELFFGHFFYGKMDTVELELLSPNDMVAHYVKLFGSLEPFESEALNELAFLSRGIFRRFKKYVRICLDNYYNSITVAEERKKERNSSPTSSSSSFITLNDIQQWITTQQLIKDMELELSGLFPKQKELRNYSVILLRKLQETRYVEQSILIQQVFGADTAAAMKGSRTLEKLEAYGYITRQCHDNNRKTVSLNGEPQP